MNTDWKDAILRGATTAGVGYVGVNTLTPSANATVKLGPVDLSMGVAFPLAIGAGSLISSLTHDYVLNHIPQSEKYKNFESASINAGLAGGSAAGLLYLSNPQDYTMKNGANIALLGIGSEIVGSYAYNNFIYPWVSNLKP